MEKNAGIYVAGHTGLVGSAIVRRLRAEGFENILVRKHGQLDLTDRRRVEKFFAAKKPEYVFIAAARVGGIHANKTYPAEFIWQNLMIQTHLIDLAWRHGVKKLLFLSSSCVYPKTCEQPMREDKMFTGAMEPTNQAYGMAKLAGMEMCRSYHAQYGARFITAIPANVYGINDHFSEDGHVLATLLHRFHQAKLNGDGQVVVWGSGGPRREFFYVDDLADACLFLMRNYEDPAPINVGIGVETSIADLARMIQSVVGYRGEIVFDTSKPDGNPRRLIDSTRMLGLGWKPRYSLEEGLRLTYAWYKKAARKKQGNHG